MFNEEARRKEQGMSSESEALVTEYRGRSIHKKFNTKDKSRGNSGDKFRGRPWTRKDVECFYCHEKGHMKKECRKLKREQQENGDASNIAATIFQGNEMGNDDRSKIVGKGDVCLETNTGCRLTLKDVRHVPDMRLNLISTGLLDEEGYT
ncbi:hypothetical protein L195_g057937, partial [Trifolium pratense]